MSRAPAMAGAMTWASRGGSKALSAEACPPPEAATRSPHDAVPTEHRARGRKTPAFGEALMQHTPGGGHNASPQCPRSKAFMRERLRHEPGCRMA